MDTNEPILLCRGIVHLRFKSVYPIADMNTQAKDSLIKNIEMRCGISKDSANTVETDRFCGFDVCRRSDTITTSQLFWITTEINRFSIPKRTRNKYHIYYKEMKGDMSAFWTHSVDPTRLTLEFKRFEVLNMYVLDSRKDVLDRARDIVNSNYFGHWSNLKSLRDYIAEQKPVRGKKERLPIYIAGNHESPVTYTVSNAPTNTFDVSQIANAFFGHQHVASPNANNF